MGWDVQRYDGARRCPWIEPSAVALPPRRPSRTLLAIDDGCAAATELPPLFVVSIFNTARRILSQYWLCCMGFTFLY
uniref:Uncharacterized protein n=1 Tax=Physcomitrium patens TaxID=3218 RepID=A0A2K1KTM0_PHYPA|nr:hypothetical protein PHYPA_004128 [Physcomitrium patens]